MTLQHARVRRGKCSCREGNENEAEAAVGASVSGLSGSVVELTAHHSEQKGKRKGRMRRSRGTTRYKDRQNLDGPLCPSGALRSKLFLKMSRFHCFCPTHTASQLRGGGNRKWMSGDNFEGFLPPLCHSTDSSILR